MLSCRVRRGGFSSWPLGTSFRFASLLFLGALVLSRCGQDSSGSWTELGGDAGYQQNQGNEPPLPSCPQPAHSCLSDVPCTDDSDCPVGQHCNYRSSPPMCQLLYCGQDGESCSEAPMCDDDLVCDGTCIPQPIVVNSDGTALDLRTHLVWTKCSDKNLCDMRLPTVTELRSLLINCVDSGACGACKASAFCADPSTCMGDCGCLTAQDRLSEGYAIGGAMKGLLGLTHDTDELLSSTLIDGPHSSDEDFAVYSLEWLTGRVRDGLNTERASSQACVVRSDYSTGPMPLTGVPGCTDHEVRIGSGCYDIELHWVDIPSGTTMMGAPEGADVGEDSLPAHDVQVPAFRMMATEVTVAQFYAVMGGLPMLNENRRPYQPVVGVAWGEAKEYCSRVGGRLPTEAEWEYAARGGSEHDFYCGDDTACLAGYEWCPPHQPATVMQDVGKLKPNPFGLFDMLSNAREWTEDCWHGSFDLDGDGVSDHNKYTAWSSDCSDADSRVVKGGRVPNDCSYLAPWLRFSGPLCWKGVHLDVTGVRCAKDR